MISNSQKRMNGCFRRIKWATGHKKRSPGSTKDGKDTDLYSSTIYPLHAPYFKTLVLPSHPRKNIRK